MLMLLLYCVCHAPTAGEIARSIATAVRDAGGLLSEADLEQHTTLSLDLMAVLHTLAPATPNRHIGTHVSALATAYALKAF